MLLKILINHWETKEKDLLVVNKALFKTLTTPVINKAFKKKLNYLARITKNLWIASMIINTYF